MKHLLYLIGHLSFQTAVRIWNFLRNNLFHIPWRRHWQWRPWYARVFPQLLPRKQSELFIRRLFSLLAHLSKADAHATASEAEAVDLFARFVLNLDGEQQLLALQSYRRAKKSAAPFAEAAHAYYALFKNNTLILENTIELLLYLAHADARYCFEEQKLIRLAVEIFGFNREDYERIKRLHFYRSAEAEREKKEAEQKARKEQQDFNQQRYEQQQQHTYFGEASSGSRAQAYDVLGLSPDASAQEIKKRYRQLALKYHPDRQIAKGVPAEMLEVAQERFRQIQEAYECLEEG